MKNCHAETTKSQSAEQRPMYLSYWRVDLAESEEDPVIGADHIWGRLPSELVSHQTGEGGGYGKG